MRQFPASMRDQRHAVCQLPLLAEASAGLTIEIRGRGLLDIEAPNIESAQMRRAGKELLSLALMDARNHTLRWIAAYERALGASLEVPLLSEINPPRWELGHIGWFQEYWIARNVQRARGAACDPTGPRLASLLAHADRWYNSSTVAHDSRWSLDLPDLQDTRQYLVQTLETTLDLLHAAPQDDAALYLYRLALFHEDMHVEAFAYMSQTLGIATGLLPPMATLAPRDPLLFPATHWMFGSAAEGFVFDNECSRHELAVPEFEIDAQAVTWSQYGEFVEDGGYDDPAFWSLEARAWLKDLQRRTPRYVDQMRHGVMQRRFGQPMRVPLAQPVMHVSWFEAQAWCAWAGRRLPTEVEWEAAAHLGATRGFRWGDVWEWTATTFHPYPGFAAGPYVDYSQPWFGTHKVLRGASFATRGRMRSAKYRNFYLPQRDDMFCGFRSCAL
ncbi:MAG: selenoneine synthase SenA [Burkholderiaceae bacterium]